MSENNGPVEKFTFPGPNVHGKYKWMWIGAGVLVVAAIILIAFFNH